MFSKRQIWGRFRDGLGWYVAVWTVSAFLEGKKDSRKYFETLEHAPLPSAADVYGEMATWVFQQDGASIQIYINAQLAYRKGCEDCRLARESPEFNNIENIWGILVRRVYARQRQFDTIAQFKGDIEEVSATIGDEVLQKLYRRIP